jgi:flagellar M-ring protein FliF
MEWLTKAGNRAAAFLQSLSPTARVMVGISLLAIGGGLLYLSSAAFQERSEYLLGGRSFSDREIDRIQTAFARAGLNGWQVEQKRIRLPRSERHLYLAALEENGAMPESFGSAWEQLFDSPGFLEPGNIRQLRERHAREKELSLVVSRMAGVELATVKYDEVETGGFPVVKRKTAMVAASARGGKPLGDDLVESIRNAVSGAIAGLESRDVTVTDLGSGRTYRGDEQPDETQRAGRAYIAAKKVFEDGWRQRLAEMLSVYPGIVIAVNADLNHESRLPRSGPRSGRPPAGTPGRTKRRRRSPGRPCRLAPHIPPVAGNDVPARCPERLVPGTSRHGIRGRPPQLLPASLAATESADRSGAGRWSDFRNAPRGRSRRSRHNRTPGPRRAAGHRDDTARRRATWLRRGAAIPSELRRRLAAGRGFDL